MKTRINKLEDAKNVWQTFKKTHFHEGLDEDRLRRKRFHFSNERLGDKVPENHLDTQLREIENQQNEKTEAAKSKWAPLPNNIDLNTRLERIKDRISIRKIQRMWRKKSESKPISINTKEEFISNNRHYNNSHSTGMLSFLHPTKRNPTIKKFVHPTLMKQLKEALKAGNWKAQIFDLLDKNDLRYVTLALWDAGHIDTHQANTVFERVQNFEHFPHRATYRILDAKDDKGQFTEEAKKILLPILKKRKIDGTVEKDLTEDQIEEFRLLVQALPLSEQIFYTTEMKHLDPNGLYATVNDPLGNFLMKKGILFNRQFSGTNELVLMGSGTRDAYGIAKYGLEEYVPLINKLNRFTISEVEQDVRKFGRPAATHYPDTVPFLENEIHNRKNVTYLEAHLHDLYHAWLISATPKKLLKAMHHLVDLLREKTKIKNSIQSWRWIDAEFGFCYHFIVYNSIVYNSSQNNELLSNSYIFVCMLLERYNYLFKTTPNLKTFNDFIIQLYLKKDISLKLTFSGVLMLIDMVANEDMWREEFGIYPQQLPPSLRYQFALVKEIYPQIKDDSPIIQLEKYRFYAQYKIEQNAQGKTKTSVQDKLVEEVFTYINLNKVNIEKEAKITKSPPSNLNIQKDKNEIIYIPSQPNTELFATIFKFDFNVEEAERYNKLKSEDSLDPLLEFKAKPNYYTWCKCNFNSLNPFKVLYLLILQASSDITKQANANAVQSIAQRKQLDKQIFDAIPQEEKNLFDQEMNTLMNTSKAYDARKQNSFTRRKI